MKKQILITIGLASLVSTSLANQEQLAQSIRDTHTEAVRTAAQLNSTMTALNRLTKQTKGDLKTAYTTFCAETGKTQEAAAETRKRVSWMAGDGMKYFDTWQASVNSIGNESLRKKAQKRLDKAKDSYGKVEQKLVQASEKFAPFLSDLGDIQKTLAADVTAGGVKAVRSTVNSANWNYQYVNDAITAARKEMDKMEKALSTEAR